MRPGGRKSRRTGYTPSVPCRPTGTLVLAVVVLAVLVFALSAVIGPASQLGALTGGLEPPEERVGGSTSEIGVFLEALGEPGRAVYTRALWWDMLNAVLVPAALGLTILWLVQRLPSVWRFLRWLALIPVAVAVADLAENVLLLAAVASFPEAAPAWAPGVTTVKLTMGLAAIPIVAVLAVMSLLLRGGR